MSATAWSSGAPFSARAKTTVPTGFCSDPPPGPARALPLVLPGPPPAAAPAAHASLFSRPAVAATEPAPPKTTVAAPTPIPVPTPGGGGRRELLQGELPDPTAIPTGCRFHPRCPRRFEPCDSVDPKLVPVGGPDQAAACLLHDPAAAGGPET